MSVKNGRWVWVLVFAGVLALAAVWSFMCVGRWLAASDGLQRCDAIVCLTGQNRLEKGLGLVREGWSERLVVSVEKGQGFDVGGRRSEGRDRGRESGVGSREETEVGGRREKTEVRCPRSDVGCPRSEGKDRGQMSDVGGQRLEDRRGKDGMTPLALLTCRCLRQMIFEVLPIPAQGRFRGFIQKAGKATKTFSRLRVWFVRDVRKAWVSGLVKDNAGMLGL